MKCCSGCQWWKKDYGIFCVNGWSGMDRDDGHCLREPVTVYKRATDICSHYEPVIPVAPRCAPGGTVMDDRNGNIYQSRDAALAAGVPAEHVQEVEYIHGELLRVTRGPFAGRVYRRTATGIVRVDAATVRKGQAKG